MRTVAAALLTVVLTAGALGRPQPASGGAPYDPNPNHLWNRIHETFHVRVARDGTRYGADTVDPLLWRDTQYLLTEPSHTTAVRLLDQFLASNGEALVTDPVKRAVFQNDLWAIFDWLVSRLPPGSRGSQDARIDLEKRIARVLRRVALSKKEIDALPDTYAEGVAAHVPLPPDLFARTGSWVAIGGDDTVAVQHAGELGRSAFIVFWNLPGGAAATSAYLRSLWDFPQPYVLDKSSPDGEVRAAINPALTQVPDGTRLALVRQMLLIDDSGAIVPSKLVQSVQLRTLPATFAEFRFSRRALFSRQGGGLRAVTPDEPDFITFSAHDEDILEMPDIRELRLSPVLGGCRNCHHVGFEPPLGTVLSLRQVLKPMTLVDSRHERWAAWFAQPFVAARAKTRTYTWGVLEGFWQNQPK